jgi:formate dehydrogenase subunit delta
VEDDKLVFMANQIAGYFRSYPEADAVAGVADHIKSFWTPGMIRSLTARLRDHRDGTEGLVVKALLGRAASEPVGEHAVGESPAEKALDGPGALGQVVSDAG